MAKKYHSHNHLHMLIGFLAVATVTFGYLLFNTTSSATNSLSYQEELSKKKCEASGQPVINVTQRVLNSVDSGEAGNNWAFDTYNRQIKVYKLTTNTYCAFVDYQGKFDAQEGERSPGNTAVLTGDEDGTFKGGYRAIIIGSMKAEPLAAKKGSLGTVNYQCDIDGNCPGAYNWMTRYFNTDATGFTSTLVWWGWTYKNGQYTWINASGGNTGDVL